MNKQEIYEYLTDRGISYEITEHQAVYNMEELSQIDMPYPEADAKNIFVRDDKKNNYYLITVKGHKRVDLKQFRKTHHTRPLSFASEDDLMRIMQLSPGSVTPLGILNDTERKVNVSIDQDFQNPPYLIGIHPNDNTATIWINTDDLVNIISEHKNPVQFIQI